LTGVQIPYLGVASARRALRMSAFAVTFPADAPLPHLLRLKL
jgi:hypothetical protein